MTALDRLLHALLLAADRPLSVAQLVELIHIAADEEEWPEAADTRTVQAALDGLTQALAPSGIELALLAQGYRLRTDPALASMVRRLWPERIQRLSKAALEALSIIAYRQPCTRIEVEDVRGVDCGGVLRNLLERKLIRIIGRKDEPGRPLLYSTTPTFLETFSLADLRALPTLRDLDAIRQEDAARAKANTVNTEAGPEPREPTNQAERDSSDVPPQDALAPDDE